MDANSDKPKVILITKENKKIKDTEQPFTGCSKRKSASYVREFVISEKEAWSLLNTLAIVIDRHTNIIRLIENGVVSESRPKEQEGKTSANLKTEKKYLADFNLLYNELNKKYLDAYNKKKYYIFKDEIKDNEHIYREEGIEVTLRADYI
jgi:hypothetical protein